MENKRKNKTKIITRKKTQNIREKSQSELK